MIRLRPILKGEGRSMRVTFTNADTEQVIDTTGWTLKVRLGRSPHVLGDLYEVTGVARCRTSRARANLLHDCGYSHVGAYGQFCGVGYPC